VIRDIVGNLDADKFIRRYDEPCRAAFILVAQIYLNGSRPGKYVNR